MPSATKPIQERSPVQEQVAGILSKVSQQSKSPNILAVCTGNLNRSALMEMILKQRAKESGVNANIHSAGTIGWQSPEVQQEILIIFKVVFGNWMASVYKDKQQMVAAHLEAAIKIIAGVPESQQLTARDIITALLKFNKEVLKN